MIDDDANEQRALALARKVPAYEIKDWFPQHRYANKAWLQNWLARWLRWVASIQS